MLLWRSSGEKHPPCVLSTALWENLALPRGVMLHWTLAGFPFTILYVVDVVDETILGLVVSIKAYTQFLCPGSVHLVSSIPCAAF